jgi:chromate transporter
MALLAKLFGLMVVIGTFTFGGGYAIIGVLQSYMVDKLHWVTLNEFTSGIVIGQVTPGPLSTMVAFVGYKMVGVVGAIAASVGLLLVPFLSAIWVAQAYERFKQLAWVQAAVQGISLSVVALLVSALLSMARSTLFVGGSLMHIDIWAVLIAAITFVICGPWKKDPVWPFVGAAVLGILLYR